MNIQGSGHRFDKIYDKKTENAFLVFPCVNGAGQPTEYSGNLIFLRIFLGTFLLSTTENDYNSYFFRTMNANASVKNKVNTRQFYTKPVLAPNSHVNSINNQDKIKL